MSIMPRSEAEAGFKKVSMITCLAESPQESGLIGSVLATSTASRLGLVLYVLLQCPG
jgi:hypothetical protein